MNREKFKTLILSILVAISILLTQQLWFPSPFEALTYIDNYKSTQSLTIAEQRKNVISPNSIIVSFGSGDRSRNQYTVLTSKLDYVWNESKSILYDYFSGDPEITQITYDEYTQSNISKSVELEFGNNIPTILISSVFDTLENKIVRNIDEIKKILIPAFNRGTIYIVENNKSIYKVKMKNYKQNNTLSSFIDEIEKDDYTRYHSIFSLFDELDSNYTPMPINYNVPTKEVFVKSAIDTNNEAMLIERSKNFFNENFDFVKTIRETSGAVVYIYGYGEKSVRINNKGILRYTESIGKISSTNVIDSLDVAINFIIQNGGFPEDTYLKDIESIYNDESKGYKFSFGYRIDGVPAEFNNNKINNPIEIEVFGDKVKSYNYLIREVLKTKSVIPEQSVMYFPIIIDNNIEYLKSRYFSNKVELEASLDEEEKTLEILKNIEEVRMVYFDNIEENKNQNLSPSWKIKIGEDVYYFNSRSGDIINSFTLN